MRSSTRSSPRSSSSFTRPRRDRAALEGRRRRAAALFDEGVSQAEVARQLKVSRESVSQWYAQWQHGGVDALKRAERAGRPPRLTSEQLTDIEAVLLAGARSNGYPTDLWTLRRVAEVIEQQTGIAYHPGHVWRILRGLGWSRQQPARRALERDEAAIAAWVKERWPALKRGPVAPSAGSSSRTRAGSR